MNCVIDCRIDNRLDNNYLELSLWGKPCYSYAIEAAENSGCFSEVYVITDSDKIKDYVRNRHSSTNVTIGDKMCIMDTSFILSGRAPCISSETIKYAVDSYDGKTLVSVKSSIVTEFTTDLISGYKNEKQKPFCAFYIVFAGGGKRILWKKEIMHFTMFLIRKQL